MNWNEMTPRERFIEKLKDIALAAAIAVTLAMLAANHLSK